MVASEKDHFLFWKANTGDPIKTVESPEAVRSNFILFTQDGKTMITAGSDGDIRLWDSDSDKVRQSLVGHKGFIMCLVLSPSGNLLASSGSDRTICIWDMKTGKQLHELSGVTYPVSALTFSQNEEAVLTFGSGKIKGINPSQLTEKIQWNIESEQKEKNGVIENFGVPFAITADGTSIVGVATRIIPVSTTQSVAERGLRVFDIIKDDFKTGITFGDYGYFAQNLKFAPNKAVLAVSTPLLYFWGGAPLEAGKRPFTLETEAKVMTFSPNSKLLATWADDLKVKVFRAP